MEHILAFGLLEELTMQVEQTGRLADIVASALECASDERAQFLKDVCRDDDSLREEAESLLRFEEATRDFLEIPAWGLTDEIGEETSVTSERASEKIETPETALPIESDVIEPVALQPETGTTPLPNELRYLFDVPPLEIREGEIPLVESTVKPFPLIDSPKQSQSPAPGPEFETPTVSVAEASPASAFEIPAPISSAPLPAVPAPEAGQGEAIEPLPRSEPEKIQPPPQPANKPAPLPRREVRGEIEREAEVQRFVEEKDGTGFWKFVFYDLARVLAIALLLVAITALVRARDKVEKLQQQRELAEAERAQADRLTNFLERTFSFSNENLTAVWPVAQRKNMTVAEMLDQIAPRIEKEFRDRPELQAGMLRMVGSAYASQGKYDAAEKNLRAAFGAQVRLHGEENSETAATMVELGILSARQLKSEEAERLLERAVAFYRREQSLKAAGFDLGRLTLALGYLGEAKFRQGDTTGGLAALEEAFKIFSCTKKADPEQSVLTFIKGQLGSAYVMLGETDKGEPLLREAIGAYRRNEKEPRWEAGQFETMLGVAALNRDQPNEAEKYLKESEQVLRRTLGDRNLYVVTNLDYQAAALAVAGNFKSAEEKARECVALSRLVSPKNKLPWAGPLRTLGNILTLAGQTKEGEENYREALIICEREPTRNFSLIVPMKIQLCHLLLAERRLTEAENLAFEAQNEARQHFDEQDPVRKAAATNLIQIYKRQGKNGVAQTVR
jgi:tetratricopeptide (TPR) repeat protein